MPHAPPPAAAPQPAAVELLEALAAAAVDMQQQLKRQEDRVEQLQLQLNNLLQQREQLQQRQAPQPGNERTSLPCVSSSSQKTVLTCQSCFAFE